MRLQNLVSGSIAGLMAVTLMACTGGDQPQRDLAVPTAMIVQPEDGASVTGPDVPIELAVDHVRLAPAGTEEPNTAHLHLFINRDVTPEGEVIPVGEGIVHLGQAQSDYTLAGVAPGNYTVIAVLGDWAHVRIAGAMTDTARIVVR